MAKKPTPALQALINAEPDLVDRIFDYILSELPEVSAAVLKHKSAVRAEFAGEKCYIANRPATQRQEQAAQVLALFNGRNTREIARKLDISPVTVWRYIKQAGNVKPLQISSK
jgi:Mor family transcriptional regulator